MVCKVLAERACATSVVDTDKDERRLLLHIFVGTSVLGEVTEHEERKR